MSFETIKISPDVVASMCCPISSAPYVDAQEVNCDNHHSFSKQSVLNIFGELQMNGQCQKVGPCPTCKGKVTSYHPNHSLQNLVNSILGLNKDKAHFDKMNEMIKNNNIEFESGIRYPLDKAHFILREFTSLEKYLLICFDNKTPTNNTIKTISLEVEVLQNQPYFTSHVFFNDEDSTSKFTFFDYLKKNHIASIEILDHYEGLKSFRSNNIKEFLSCLNLFMHTNQLDNKAQAQVHKFLECLKKLVPSA